MWFKGHTKKKVTQSLTYGARLCVTPSESHKKKKVHKVSVWCIWCETLCDCVTLRVCVCGVCDCVTVSPHTYNPRVTHSHYSVSVH